MFAVTVCLIAPPSEYNQFFPFPDHLRNKRSADHPPLHHAAPFHHATPFHHAPSVHHEPAYAPPHKVHHAPNPIYTFVKTDPHANFKWGVKHLAGVQYGR